MVLYGQHALNASTLFRVREKDWFFNDNTIVFHSIRLTVINESLVIEKRQCADNTSKQSSNVKGREVFTPRVYLESI